MLNIAVKKKKENETKMMCSGGEKSLMCESEKMNTEIDGK